ncbi:uncharacterized protein LOC116692376 [Etheostoma spectabile]|uniref:uncharacterized protein LOC116692376 n=1 Tax=Etheostoma spectabile TaxID=54343 RepID=UPI0013AEE9F4|nr:uncharacterized protein LOC116692376 [Etheostoma spectabile]
MKSSGPFLVLLFLLSLSSTASGLGSVVQRNYFYISEYLTWKDAQSYCRSLTPDTDLATIFTQSDANSLNMVVYHAWTGLYKIDNSYWAWTTSYGFDVNADDNQYRWGESWTPSDDNNCAIVYHNNQKFYARHCNGNYFFFCIEYTIYGTYKYMFIPQAMSWSKARQYCQSNGARDLASFPYNSDLYSTVINRDFPVWTGLYRKGKDHTISSYKLLIYSNHIHKSGERS